MLVLSCRVDSIKYCQICPWFPAGACLNLGSSWRALCRWVTDQFRGQSESDLRTVQDSLLGYGERKWHMSWFFQSNLTATVWHAGKCCGSAGGSVRPHSAHHCCCLLELSPGWPSLSSWIPHCFSDYDLTILGCCDTCSLATLPGSLPSSIHPPQPVETPNASMKYLRKPQYPCQLADKI